MVAPPPPRTLAAHAGCSSAAATQMLPPCCAAATEVPPLPVLATSPLLQRTRARCFLRRCSSHPRTHRVGFCGPQFSDHATELVTVNFLIFTVNLPIFTVNISIAFFALQIGLHSTHSTRLHTHTVPRGEGKLCGGGFFPESCLQGLQGKPQASRLL